MRYQIQPCISYVSTGVKLKLNISTAREMEFHMYWVVQKMYPSEFVVLFYYRPFGTEKFYPGSTSLESS